MILRLLRHWLILVLGLFLITEIKPLGISSDSSKDLFWAAVVLIIANTIIKPILILFTLPLVLLTLGLFLLIINAVILYWIPYFVPGFHVHGFISAFFGALVLSLITGLFSGYKRRTSVRRMNVAPPAPRSDKVIDI